MNATAEKLTLAIVSAAVGAATGVVPVVLNTRLQAREASHQRSVERKFDAIKSYAAACHREVVVGRRVVLFFDMVSGMAAEPSSIPAFPGISDFLLRQFEAIQREMEDAIVNVRTEVDSVNGLFGTTFVSPAEPLVVPPSEAATQQAKKALEEYRQKLPTLAGECAANVKTLTARIE